MLISSAAVIGLLAGSLMFVSPASAAPTLTAEDCGPAQRFGSMCYFFRSYYRGAQAGFFGDFWDLEYPWYWVYGAGEGQGQRVSYNAGSGHNRDTSCNVVIGSETYYHGDTLNLTRGHSHPTLGIVNNRNRSHHFHTCI
jgi:hypothetical protein